MAGIKSVNLMKRFVILVLSILQLFCSCSKSPSEMILGTWQVTESYVNGEYQTANANPVVYQFDASGDYHKLVYSAHDMFDQKNGKYTYDASRFVLVMDSSYEIVASFQTQNKMIWKWSEGTTQYKQVFMRSN